MKHKLLLLLAFVTIISSASIAQKVGSKEQITAYRQTQTIENTFIRENSDPEAVKVIKAYRKAKKMMENKMKVSDGYGKSATSKESIEKYRLKLEKKDDQFRKLSEDERRLRKEKEDYLITVSDEYKKLLPVANPR